MRRIHTNPQCPVRAWEKYGYGYDRPKCVCLDAEPEPEPMTLDLPFDETPAVESAKPTGPIPWCTNCGATAGYHRSWCYHLRLGRMRAEGE